MAMGGPNICILRRRLSYCHSINRASVKSACVRTYLTVLKKRLYLINKMFFIKITTLRRVCYLYRVETESRVLESQEEEPTS